MMGPGGPGMVPMRPGGPGPGPMGPGPGPMMPGKTFSFNFHHLNLPYSVKSVEHWLEGCRFKCKDDGIRLCVGACTPGAPGAIPVGKRLTIYYIVF